MVTEARDERANERRVFAEDVLVALLYFAVQEREGDDLREFKSYDFDLQAIFSSLTEEYPVLKKYFLFSKSGPKPFSPALNNALSELQLGGLIARQNPEYQVLVVKPTAQRYVQDHLLEVLEDELSGEELQDLQRAAHDFEERVAG